MEQSPQVSYNSDYAYAGDIKVNYDNIQTYASDPHSSFSNDKVIYFCNSAPLCLTVKKTVR